MPSTNTRRAFLGSLTSLAALGSAGCIGGNDHSEDETKTDRLVLSNHRGDEQVVSLVVRRDGERVAGGRYRIPKNTGLYLERKFDWGTYAVLGKLHRDEESYERWQSWTWKPRSCATTDNTNDDGYWTGTVRIGDSELGFSHSECPTEFGGPGGGGGNGNRAVKADDHRLGDVTDAPTTTDSE